MQRRLAVLIDFRGVATNLDWYSGVGSRPENHLKDLLSSLRALLVRLSTLHCVVP